MAFEIVANLDDLEPGETLFVEGLREPICLVRLDEDDVRAVHNTCTISSSPCTRAPCRTTTRWSARRTTPGST